MRAQTTRTWTAWGKRPAGAHCTKTGCPRVTWDKWTCRSSTTRTAPRPTTQVAWSLITWFAQDTKRVGRILARATVADRWWGWWTTSGSKSLVRTCLLYYDPCTKDSKILTNLELRRVKGSRLVLSRRAWLFFGLFLSIKKI